MTEAAAGPALRGKTILVSGGSRGIGLAIAVRAARDGANVVLAAKTDKPHRVLPGTIHTAAEQVQTAGGRALPVVCDVRDEAQILAVAERAKGTFGGIDALVLNASALALQGTLDLPAKRYDLMSDINQRGAFLMGKACLPHLIEADNPHILAISTSTPTIRPGLHSSTCWSMSPAGTITGVIDQQHSAACKCSHKTHLAVIVMQ